MRPNDGGPFTTLSPRQLLTPTPYAIASHTASNLLGSLDGAGFQGAFGVGESDTGISTVDADGVALAAIQGLNQKLEETRAENAELRQRPAELEQVCGKSASR